MLLDAELLPWSVKAEGLLRDQYAPVGAGAELALPAALAALDRVDPATPAGAELAALRARTAARLANATAFRAVYRRYCWPVDGLDGVRLVSSPR